MIFRYILNDFYKKKIKITFFYKIGSIKVVLIESKLLVGLVF